MSTKLSSKDLILHFLCAKGANGKKFESISGRTRFQKMVFLFEKELWKEFKFDKLISENELPQFEPYDFGPFSAEIYNDLDFLESLGFIQKEKIQKNNLSIEDSFEENLWEEEQGVNSNSDFNIDTEEDVFSITALGKEFVKAGEAGQLSANQVQVLDDFKTRCCKISLNSLLEYVYKKYPAMTSKSLIKDKILGEESL